MSQGIIEFDNKHWKCNNCGKTGDANLSVPKKCPQCDSTDIYAPLIKKGGPHDRHPWKKH